MRDWIGRMLLGALMLVAAGCGGSRDPVQEIQKTLASAPSYSLILEDMREEGMIFSQYYHKYRVIQDQRAVVTDWVEVSETVYQRYEPFLGMSLASKVEGQVNATPHPPGYDYVGNSRYGRWDSGGFWVFYGQYAMMQNLMGYGMGRRINRAEYDDYRTNRRAGRPYYGQKKDFGTNGSLTKRQKPSFFQRRQQRTQMQRSSFSQKARSRIGRSQSGFGGRGGGFGK